MNPPCASCGKTVYPVEKLNCLDKVWHKKCFTCQTCNMKLTMKNYKGYNKFPYCNAHYPTTKFTAVADTPENLRLKKQTETQSQVEYHKKFVEERGTYTAVSDDPESLRLKKNSEQQSGIRYRTPSDSGHEPAPPQSYRAPQQSYNAPQQSYNAPQAAPAAHHMPAPEPVPTQAPAPPMPQQVRYRAIYDYVAADDDEISFQEGDTIVDVNIIDSGWMEGRNEMTGKFGMLPSNYVEEI